MSYLLAGKEHTKMILRCLEPAERESMIEYIKNKNPEIQKYNYDDMLA